MIGGDWKHTVFTRKLAIFKANNYVTRKLIHVLSNADGTFRVFITTLQTEHHAYSEKFHRVPRPKTLFLSGFLCAVSSELEILVHSAHLAHDRNFSIPIFGVSNISPFCSFSVALFSPFPRYSRFSLPLSTARDGAKAGLAAERPREKENFASGGGRLKGGERERELYVGRRRDLERPRRRTGRIRTTPGAQ